MLIKQRLPAFTLLVFTMFGLFFAWYFDPHPMLNDPQQARLFNVRFHPHSNHEVAWFDSNDNYPEQAVALEGMNESRQAELLLYLSTCEERRTFTKVRHVFLDDIELSLSVLQASGETKWITLGVNSWISDLGPPYHSAVLQADKVISRVKEIVHYDPDLP